MSNEDVLETLTSIRGIGIWSAQMFLMFQLRRKDVFAPGDLGLRKAMSLLYGFSMDGSDKIWQ
jgi:DNA-3-methyladenine glycosylase II